MTARLCQMAAVLRRFSRNTRGSMAIETAIVAPVLVMMSIGTFEVSRMVARQHELQSGVAEAEAIVLAANMGAETNTQQLGSMLRDSLDLKGEQVKVVKLYRCNTQTTLKSSADDCDHGNDVLSTYVRITLVDRYKPIWSRMGITGNYDYSVIRTVQLS